MQTAWLPASFILLRSEDLPSDYCVGVEQPGAVGTGSATPVCLGVMISARNAATPPGTGVTAPAGSMQETGKGESATSVSAEQSTPSAQPAGPVRRSTFQV